MKLDKKNQSAFGGSNDHSSEMTCAISVTRVGDALASEPEQTRLFDETTQRVMGKRNSLLLVLEMALNTDYFSSDTASQQLLRCRWSLLYGKFTSSSVYISCGFLDVCMSFGIGCTPPCFLESAYVSYGFLDL